MGEKNRGRDNEHLHKSGGGGGRGRYTPITLLPAHRTIPNSPTVELLHHSPRPSYSAYRTTYTLVFFYFLPGRSDKSKAMGRLHHTVWYPTIHDHVLPTSHHGSFKAIHIILNFPSLSQKLELNSFLKKNCYGKEVK
jgi:hypothetical protein